MTPHAVCPLCGRNQLPISGVHARTCEGCGAHIQARTQTVDGVTTLIVVARPAEASADSPTMWVDGAWERGGCPLPDHVCALRDAVDYIATPLDPSLVEAMERMAARERGGER